MPWEQTSAMDQRVKFIADWLSKEYSKIELCRAYGISRPTADKWIKRYQDGGVEALEERSRAAHRHRNETPEEIREMIIAIKLSHPSWGPKKVLDYLGEKKPKLTWPADSTAGAILKRAGLVNRRVRRRHVAPYSEPFSDCHGPNQIWSADFKGDFLLGNGQRCYPLTLTDNFSRYLLMCQALGQHSYRVVRPWFERAFRQYGLPGPFVPTTEHRLPRSVWAVSASCRSGGSSLASVLNGSSRVSQARTGAMNGCIEPLNTMLRPSQPTDDNSENLIFS